MDLMTGLSAASQAIGLAKQLRDLDRALDESAFKAKLLELQEALFETKSALLDAKEALLVKDTRIAELEGVIEEIRSGETCPICQKGQLKVTGSRPHPHFGTFGHQERTLTCTNIDCGHSEKRKFDPSGTS